MTYDQLIDELFDAQDNDTDGSDELAPYAEELDILSSSVAP